MLRDLKLGLLRAARAAGVFRLVRDSGWRARQLLILCYHGVSIDDEHRWAPGLYMPAEQFRRRLEQLRDGHYNVLPLGEAVRRLHDGTLPPRSVAITFDDGNYDFYIRAWPVLRDFGFPVTVYLTTHYAEHDLPVFPLAVGYVLWKGARTVARFRLGDREVTVDTRAEAGRRRARDLVQLRAQELQLSTAEKDVLVERLATALGVDYAALRARRLLQIMRGEEACELAAAGVDLQLHTHRHRSPLDEAPYRAEIADNRERIAAITGERPTHFCYPSGVCMPQFAEWLAAEGVLTATTCEPGMATRTASPLALPRLLDHSEMTELEFESWLAGLGALLPRRAVGFTPVTREGYLVIAPVDEPWPFAEPLPLAPAS